MKKYIFAIIFFASICCSCSEIYDPSTNPSKDVLVVDGLITDQRGYYTVTLSTALSFNGTPSVNPATSAKVSILDDLGNVYNLMQNVSGSYITDSTQFVGMPGRSYTLHIETKDGNIYESSPQKLIGSNYNEKVYGENAVTSDLVGTGSGEVLTTEGLNLLDDITGDGSVGSLHIRFKPLIVTEYFYIVEKPMAPPTFIYGWYIYPNKDINLTEEKYQTSSTDIMKQKICFVTKENSFSTEHEGKPVNANVVNKIIKVSQYRLNNDTYEYYKNVKTLLAAEGKLFDPIAFQLKGNIHCVTDPQKLALGFFEASSLRVNCYVNKPFSSGFAKIPDFNPPAHSGSQDSIPTFWIN